MNYENVRKGLKKVFLSELFNVIVSVLVVVLMVIGILMISQTTEIESKVGLLAGMTIGAIIAVIAIIVLSILAFVFSIIGLVKAGKDEPEFNKAKLYLFFSIILSISTALLINSEILGRILQLLTNVSHLLVTLHIISGISDLSEKFKDKQVFEKAKKTRNLILIAYVIILLSNLLSIIPFTSIVTAILLIIAAVILLVQYFLYVSLLGKASKMLKKQAENA